MTATSARSSRGPRPPRWVLVVAILGSTMVMVDGTVVNVALPVMQRELGAGIDEAQWIVEAFALLLAALVLVGGALGDRLGRRRVFLAGVALFALASAACGLAPSPVVLIAGRALQGIGGALLVPGSLALIGAAYPEPSRDAAIGTWSACTSLASAVGPVLGGWVVVHASWRWLFFFNVPLGAVVAVLATRHVVESRDEHRSSRIDVAGALLAVVGLGAIVWALLEAPRAGGLGSIRTLAPLAGGVLALVAFVVVEARVSEPMVPLGLFRSRAFSGANLATALLYAALGACLFFVPFNLIEVQGYPPTSAGAALLPLVALISSLSRWAGHLVSRIGPRPPMVVGALLTTAAFVLLAMPSVGGSYWTTFFPGLAVLGLGLGVTIAPLTATALSTVDPGHAGTASGINNAIARTAGLLAIAALGLVMTNRFDQSLGHALDAMATAPATRAFIEAQRSKLAAAELPAGLDASTRVALRHALDAAFVTGFRWLMACCATLAAGAALASFVLLAGLDPRHISPKTSGHRPPGA